VSLLPRSMMLWSLLLWSIQALAQEVPRSRELTRRRVALNSVPADQPVELHVAPGDLTALEFDTPVDRAGVTVGEARDRFAMFEVNERLIVVSPRNGFSANDRVQLSVPFADGLAPVRAVFLLVTHPTEVDAQVKVSRAPRTTEALQAELDEVRAVCALKDRELETLRVRKDVEGLTELLLKGVIGLNGIAVDTTELRLKPVHGLRASSLTRYLADQWAALIIRVQNTSASPWTPEEARLFFPGGTRFRSLPVRMKGTSIEPGQQGDVVVETGAPRELMRQLPRIELRDPTGERPLLIPAVLF
jgi:uncharacterized protein (TIGR02268 family)